MSISLAHLVDLFDNAIKQPKDDIGIRHSIYSIFCNTYKDAKQAVEMIRTNTPGTTTIDYSSPIVLTLEIKKSDEWLKIIIMVYSGNPIKKIMHSVFTGALLSKIFKDTDLESMVKCRIHRFPRNAVDSEIWYF